MMIELRTDWAVAEARYPAGALLVIGFDAFMAGGRDFTTLFAPSRARLPARLRHRRAT